MMERTLNDLAKDFDTGTRVEDRETGRKGIVLMRDRHLGAWVLWDEHDAPLHHGSAAALVGLGPRMTTAELSARRAAAVDCTSAAAAATAGPVSIDPRHVDPFDTGSLDGM